MLPQKKLAYITFVYWFLLVYMVAALVWWFIALNRQTDEMTSLRISQLTGSEANYAEKLAEAESFKSRKVTQYTGEGAIFLILILVGAVFVYRATRKQLQLAQQQQNFMMAITHELKTPIAVAKLNLETLQRRKLDEAKQQELLQSALLETERLNDLTNNILLASRMDGGEQEYFSEIIDMQLLLQEVLRQFKARYPDRIINYQAHKTNSIKGDSLLIKLLINNLLDNAIKYTDASAVITLSVDQEEKSVLLRVADTGAGIPEEEKQKIFQKFYRMGSEATRRAKGTGLGLYLCSRIVAGHGGSIRVEDNLPHGSIFMVQLPAHLF
jgi:two-component system, OmpR family, sensor histidine kinase CiaH